VDKSPETFHSPAYLSTEIVDNSSKLWIKTAMKEDFRQIVTFECRDACG
jgi:hypothetical protein